MKSQSFWAAGVALAALAGLSPARAATDLARWRQEAAHVDIVRDDWGIAHVHGRSDADAVFGAVYAQAEDDFSRIESNYLTSLGRRAEAEGEGAIWGDLRQKLFIDEAVLKRDYLASPAWLKALTVAWADGLNYYLATHRDVRPKVITRFEPWMALSFTEGSIGGDIERVGLKELQAFYDKPGVAEAETRAQLADAEDLTRFHEPTGSNGIAIAPKSTADGHALLLINPHTSFFFRSELQMSSDQGLNAYGASTWGQFFIYQGFNPHIGWMHTSTAVDAVDEFAETIVRQGGKTFYRYGAELRPVTERAITVAYKTADGGRASRRFTVFATHHGPIVRAADGRWISMALMNKPIPALSQSWLRTRAFDLKSFVKIAETYRANSSNNTLLADDKGEIAFLSPQFTPRRDDRFDYTQPVDGADPATDWKGPTPLADTPHVIDPRVGWVMNTNNWPYSAAGPDSPKPADYPRYFDTVGETPRGQHALRLLEGRKDFTLESLNRAAFDSYLPAFGRLIPKLLAAYDAAPDADPLKARLKDEIATLRAWDDRWGLDSVPTSLAVFWGERLWTDAGPAAKAAKVSVYDWMADRMTPAQKLQALADASDRLTRDFGTWKTPWGQINRFQRLNDDIVPTFHDDQPSLPVPFTGSQWGTLAAFGAQPYPGTKKYYGTKGNSFVAIVEFGPKVRAVAVTAGGESGHPGAKHFDDEAQRYADGALRPVYFYPADLVGHTERRYRPGE